MANQNFYWYKTDIEGCYRIKSFNSTDSRGGFTKPFKQSDFVPSFGARWRSDQFPVPFSVREVYYSTNRRGVIRGLHIQKGTAKLVTCAKGIIQDVVVDLRPESKTYGQHIVYYLYDGEAIFVPAGCAHGFRSRTSSIVLYICDEEHTPEYDEGIRYDDPELGIKWTWPDDKIIVSVRDKKLPTFAEWRKKHGHD